MKVPIIELLEFNFLMSLLDYFNSNFSDKRVGNKKIKVVQSYSDRHIPYTSPSLSVEVLYRRNRSTGFGSFVGEEFLENDIFEYEGTLMEYRVQLNVYSNTRGEIHKWCSILDDVLKNGEGNMPLNTYLDNGSIKQKSIGIIDYDYSFDVSNNNLAPNVVSYDFHTIYEVRMKVVQLYKIAYQYAELGDIIGKLK